MSGSAGSLLWKSHGRGQGFTRWESVIGTSFDGQSFGFRGVCVDRRGTVQFDRVFRDETVYRQKFIEENNLKIDQEDT